MGIEGRGRDREIPGGRKDGAWDRWPGWESEGMRMAAEGLTRPRAILNTGWPSKSRMLLHREDIGSPETFWGFSPGGDTRAES